MRLLPRLLLSLLTLSALALAQNDAAESALRDAFLGRQIAVKIDMPGTQKGIDLHFDRATPIDWDDYGNRMKAFGVALHNGDRATITQIVVKRDHIEFQLDGGGFGTAHDNAGPISADSVPESERERDLKKQLKNETDPDRRRYLERELDHERDRRQREQNRANSAAQVANEIKAGEVAQRRLTGGSRFNLRWKDVVPPDQLTPEALRARLGSYVDFNPPAMPVAQSQPAPREQPAANIVCRTGSVSAIFVGMRLDEVRQMFGPGQLVLEEQTASGITNQDFVFMTDEARIRATFANGVVVRYMITSR